MPARVPRWFAYPPTIATSRSFVVDSDARCRRLHDRVREAVGGVTADDLESLLGDYRSPDALDLGDDVERLSGDCIVSAMTMQSIVAEPESRRERLSVGHSPAGLGPYVSVPWSWDGAVGEVPFEGVPGAATGRTHRGDALTDAQRATARAYAEAAHAHLLGVAPAALRPRFEDLVRRAPRDPGSRTLAALFALVTDDFTAARDHLRAALALEGGAVRRARLLLWQSRVLAVLGEAGAADALRAELTARTGDNTKTTRDGAAHDARRPVSRGRLRRIAPDVYLIDAALTV